MRALFVTSKPSKLHACKCWGISADALAGVMKRMMHKSGVPEDFLPHSARHAGIALKKKQGWSDEEVMRCANMGQRTYVTHYMRQIRRRVVPVLLPVAET
eukprot:COSAG01_NODE_13234_length_1616_cov_1.682268_2_plen_100_part_00